MSMPVFWEKYFKMLSAEFFKPWAQLLETNDVASIVKIYIEWYANMLKFFAEKMWVAFAVKKLLTFFQQ